MNRPQSTHEPVEPTTDKAQRVALYALMRAAVFSVAAILTLACGDDSADAIAPPVAPAQPTVRSIGIQPDREYLLVGEVLELRWVVLADARVSTAVAWISGAPSVATVSGTGEVTAISPGTATVTARSIVVPSVSETMTVEVRAPSIYGKGFSEEQFALIPAGSFQMGSNENEAYENERPVRTVTISQPFLMQRTEVTQAQWREVMEGTGFENPSSQTECDHCPVDQVSWNDIQFFITRLNEGDPGKSYRLPTEAEWEYAARSGTSGGGYPGNGILNEMAWSWANSGRRTRPVAWRLANAFGLFDLHGNVHEWVNDWYLDNYYGVAPNVDPPGPTAGSRRVLRGGSAYMFDEYLRTAFRSAFTPFGREQGYGFRLTRVP